MRGEYYGGDVIALVSYWSDPKFEWMCTCQATCKALYLVLLCAYAPLLYSAHFYRKRRSCIQESYKATLYTSNMDFQAISKNQTLYGYSIVSMQSAGNQIFCVGLKRLPPILAVPFTLLISTNVSNMEGYLPRYVQSTSLVPRPFSWPFNVARFQHWKVRRRAWGRGYNPHK